MRQDAAGTLIDITDGRIDDVEIVTTLVAGGPDYCGDDLDEALWKVAEHGKTKAVRAAAPKKLSSGLRDRLRRKGLLVTEEEVAQEMSEEAAREMAQEARRVVASCVYFSVTIVLWGLMFRRSLREIRVTPWSLMTLVVLIAIGVLVLPILIR
jgi:hypothetical protein